MRFSGKRAVVTGGASGIGRATALRLAEEGAEVIVGDIDEAGGAALTEIANGRIAFQRTDVTRAEEIEALVTAAEAAGGLDILFNNAGAGGAREPIDQISPEDWDHTQALLLRSVALGIRYAAPLMAKRGGAAIINTSTLGLDGAARDQANAAIADMAAHAQPIARTGRAEDIAAAVAFLASDDASFITGTHILVDGGLTIGTRQSWDPSQPSMLAALEQFAA